jgi:hypothetical protein
MTRPNRKSMPTGKQDIAERHRLDDALNDGLEETFPASDALCITQPLQSKRDNHLNRHGQIPFRMNVMTLTLILRTQGARLTCNPHKPTSCRRQSLRRTGLRVRERLDVQAFRDHDAIPPFSKPRALGYCKNPTG